MRELSKNDWRVLAAVLEKVSPTLQGFGDINRFMTNTPENIRLATAIDEIHGVRETVQTTAGYVLTRDDWLMDFFASIAQENSE